MIHIFRIDNLFICPNNDIVCLVAQAILICGHPSANTNIDVVEVIVGSEVVGHVRQYHCVFK